MAKTKELILFGQDISSADRETRKLANKCTVGPLIILLKGLLECCT